MRYPHKTTSILWIVDHLGYGGVLHGAGTYYRKTIPIIDRGKYRIHLCVLRKRDALARIFEEIGIPIEHLERGKFDPRTLFDILKIIRKEKTDLIHAHGYGAANFGRIAGAIAGIPTLVHAHDDDRRYPVSQAIADYCLNRLTSGAIAVSESVKASCIRKRRIREDRIHILRNGISLDYFCTPGAERIEKERERFGIRPRSTVIGTVTRLREEKGNRYFLESVPQVLKKFPETVFLIAGDGPQKEELCTLAASLGIRNRVIFAGYCEDVPAILSLVSIVVIPSLTEGCPSALLEAMAMGKPIIATDVGGMKEIVVDGKTGVLIPAKDPKTQAETIVWLMENQLLAQELGRQAKEESRKYDVAIHGRNLENYYDQLIAERNVCWTEDRFGGPTALPTTNRSQK